MHEAIGWGIISQTGAHLMGCCIFGETVITHLAGGHYTYAFTYGDGLGLKPVCLM